MEVRSKESKRTSQQISLIHKTVKKNHKKENFPRTNHLGWKYIRGDSITKNQFEKFIKILYKGLFYSLNNLLGPSQQYLSKKEIQLPEPKGSSKKLLLLDLDQTLIHSVNQGQAADITLIQGLRFNIRPYCFQFLKEMSKLYNIYIFTASSQAYATAIVNFINSKVNVILGILHRKHCMQTQNGLYIKDLRIIENRGLKDIILIDNLMHSFGLQPHNGIPILQFKNNSDDRELLELIPLLSRLNTHPDSQHFLKNHLRLTKILEISEKEFINCSNETFRYQ